MARRAAHEGLITGPSWHHSMREDERIWVVKEPIRVREEPLTAPPRQLQVLIAIVGFQSGRRVRFGVAIPMNAFVVSGLVKRRAQLAGEIGACPRSPPQDGIGSREPGRDHPAIRPRLWV
jgi:hypothetical protein